jgi:hypothetical protein
MAASDAWLVRCSIRFAKDMCGIRDATSPDLEGEGAFSQKIPYVNRFARGFANSDYTTSHS